MKRNALKRGQQAQAQQAHVGTWGYNMQRNKYERELITFLQKYPNRWHSWQGDAKTTRVVAVLALLHNLIVNITTCQMYWPGKGYVTGLWSKGDNLWANAVQKIKGDVAMSWQGRECRLGTGEVFKP